MQLPLTTKRMASPRTFANGTIGRLHRKLLYSVAEIARWHDDYATEELSGICEEAKSRLQELEGDSYRPFRGISRVISTV